MSGMTDIDYGIISMICGVVGTVASIKGHLKLGGLCIIVCVIGIIGMNVN